MERRGKGDRTEASVGDVSELECDGEVGVDDGVLLGAAPRSVAAGTQVTQRRPIVLGHPRGYTETGAARSQDRKLSWHHAPWAH